ncbi:MAG TPA: GDSL-type esterase/lipase family protein [Clostridium sp.]|uniref:GDSL-type esterase/lipase family protein n=1 Tax=Clostridium sp. TaxID=1506 RepID=UPI002F94F395
MKIICLGDSLTCGYQLKKKDSWPFMLEEETKMQVVDKGIPGDTTTGMLSRFYRDVIDEKPTHTIIMGGTNDLVYGIPLSIIKGNLSSLVFQAYHYNIMPVLGIPIPIVLSIAKENFQFTQNFEEVNEKLVECRDWIIKFAALSNCKVIDFYKEFKAKQTNQGKVEYYKDGVHPTIEGNKKMKKTVISELL